MNKRLGSVLLFALIVSALASVLVYRLVSTRLSVQTAQGNKKVVVAARNLDVGTLLRDSDVKLVTWNGDPPKGAVETVDAATGRGVISAIYEGEPVIDSRLAAKGAGGGLAATIPQGMRAVAVRVNEVVGVSGFVSPGMHVDVIISGNPPQAQNSASGTMAKTILQDIEVLSAGPNIQRDAEGKPVTVAVVNLLVTPAQAETLSLASNETKIQLVLRNPLDKKITDTPGTAVANLFGSPVKPVRPEVHASARRPVRAVEVKKAEPVKPPPPILIDVIQGTKRTEIKFPGQGGKDH